MVRRLYRDLDGYLIDEAEKRRVQQAQSSSTYGELMPTATYRLLEHLAPTPHDVFYDLGSGIGQVALHAALATPVARSVGLELCPTRHQTALEALARARNAGLPRARACAFENRNFMKSGLGEATLVYACSTAFPFALMQRLITKLARNRVGLVFASLQDLDDNAWFEHTKTLHLDTSWKRRTAVFVYRLVRQKK